MANTHDSLALKPMVKGRRTRRDPHRGRYFKPQRLHTFQSRNLRQQAMPDPKPKDAAQHPPVRQRLPSRVPKPAFTGMTLER